MQVYTGRDELNPAHNCAKNVVLRLSEYLESGYNITTDQFFTSIEFARAAHETAPHDVAGHADPTKGGNPGEFPGKGSE